MLVTKRLWLALGVVFFVSFALLGNLGSQIYQVAPPIPEKVMVAGGDTVLFNKDQIEKGQNVWQSMGGHDTGSIWGHGSYLAPDWSADWLHREAVALLDVYASKDEGVPYAVVSMEKQAGLKERLKTEMRANTYDAESGVLTISADRAAAVESVKAHYAALFSDDPALESLREDYAIKNNPVPSAENRDALNAFVFWTAWAATTERPGDTITYTSNWPHEELVGNQPISSMLVWTMFSVLAMMAGVGFLAWYHVSQVAHEGPISIPSSNPLAGVQLTPSMKASFKFFAVVAALFIVQIAMGGRDRALLGRRT
jgi:nitric oxide reductase subunit B